ncbi:essential MCU regulator, mitochondrial [Ceratitis capitata]|uniref:essential MCU regulator, mitochondrial n=1 Tax=Ceratitis capitata TaxID=7213 RepID=UPI00032996CA|nr:essential MCU regulator, mitochondrial [Ceratitis capitata]XP_004534643.1 essential MCU regulator, mitochondrial [Ceratitis capitata]
MVISRLIRPLLTARGVMGHTLGKRSKLAYMTQGTHFRSGALKPKPHQTPFGMVFVFCAVLPGLFLGAAISKSVANFLEENDLFVPSEDDDDDDDD